MIDLSKYPRAELGHWPTPIERCGRVDAACELWIKRDDCSGLAFGGNKTRKLEFLLGRALVDGAKRVVTFGALQSNHARQTAAACAKLGLPCELILTRLVDKRSSAYEASGNVLLDHALGAKVHIADEEDEAVELLGRIADGDTFVIVPGGSNVTGTLGYVNAGLEIASQDRSFDRIYVAASTGGTAAGLILGVAAAGLDAVVDVVCVYRSADETASDIRTLLASTAEELGIDVPSDDRWTISDDALGDGYGVPTAEGLGAISLLARTEGVLLDPVYTSKTFAYLLRDPNARGRRVLFVHTGGGPGLFAYADDISSDAIS